MFRTIKSVLNVKVYVLRTLTAGRRNITPTVNGAVILIPTKSEDTPGEKPLPVKTDVLSTKKGIAKIYGLSFWTALWARKTLQRFLQTDIVDPEESYLFVWDWKTKSYKSIHGKAPESYDEVFPETND